MTGSTHDHLTDAELIARLDEPGPARPETAAHLAACEPCRVRLAALEGLFADLRAAAPPADDEALAGQRERIAAAIRARPRGRVRPLASRILVPLAVAAALGGIVILGRRGLDRDPAAGALAVDTAARHAAEAALVALEETAMDTLALAALEPALATSPADEEAFAPILERIALEDELAALPADDQAAILAELETMAIDL